jgi:peptidoglycan/LPS O-acetylase OafA/YrhL
LLAPPNAAAREDASIEALRGFAALMVVAVHYAHFVSGAPGAWGFAATGVDLFFVLSGYVFGPYFFGRPLAWGPHLVRRVFRLYPLYLLALALYVALKLPDAGATRYLVDHLFMAHTLRSMEIAFFYNPAFWSLPPEVEFYLVLPLLAGLLRGRAFFGLLALAAASHFALVALGRPDEGVTPRALATVHLPGLLIEFCLGAWAWRASQREGGRWIRGLLGLALVAAMVGVFAAYLADAEQRTRASLWISGNMGLGAAAGYALVVSALAGRPNPSGRVLALCVLAGDLSYGVYLFHNAFPVLLGKLGWSLGGWPAIAACLAATFALAWALHQLVEAPARNFGRALSRRIAARRSPA